MATTLDFEIKEYLPLLVKDNRWNVLTVLILHTNVRNRCAVGMDVIASMATGGDKTKATRAKKWLEQHGVFELVSYGKRVGEERDLPPRQHVYQLTGLIKPCGQLDCDCAALVTTRKYLHQDNVLNGQNIRESNVQDGQNIKVPNGQNNGLPNVPNGQNLSIKDKRSARKQNQKVRDLKSYDDVPHDQRTAIIHAWASTLLAKPVNAYATDTNHEAAAALVRAEYKPEQVTRYVQAMMQDDYWKGKTLTLAKVGELMPGWLVANPEGQPAKPQNDFDRLKIITADNTQKGVA